MPKKIIAVGGGKGGVGKSIIAANLAIAMAQKHRKCALIDADLGGANLHTLFGIDRPRMLLEHFITGKVASLSDVFIPTKQEGLSIICGGMPVLGTANPKFAQKAKLIRHFRMLDFDVIVLDIGAGIGFNVLDLFNAAEYKIVAFTPQLTSLHNGYGFLKAAVHRRLDRLIAREAREFLHNSSPESGEESLRQIIQRIAAFNQDEAEKARIIVDEQRVFLVGNMVRSERDRHVMSALKQMIKDHLLIEAELLGALKYGDKIERSVNERRPFMSFAGIEYNAEVFRAMAHFILSDRLSSSRRPSQTSVITKSMDTEPPGKKRKSASPYNRKEPRYPTRKLNVVLACGPDMFHGKMINIAHGGALVSFGVKVPNPASGRLVAGPSPNGLILEVEVEERHRSRNGMQIGYAFVHLTRKLSLTVADLVAEAAATIAVDRVSQID